MTVVKTHDTKRSETQLIGEARLAHVFLHEKRTKSAGGALLDKPHFSAVVMLPKLGPAESCPNYKRLSDMCMEAALKAWNKWPDGGKWPIQDGDQPFPHKPKPGDTALTPAQLAERNKWRTGSWCVEVSNHLPGGPKVSVLQNGILQDIPAQNVGGVQLYKSGDYGFVSMNAYSFHSEKGTWGVNCGFEGVAYTRQGELIGGGPKSSAQMFAGIPVGVGMATPGPAAPVAGPPPAAPAAPPLPAFPAPAAAGAPPMPPLPR
jgi:Protein of unknown function (DUF2815)